MTSPLMMPIVVWLQNGAVFSEREASTGDDASGGHACKRRKDVGDV